MVSSELVTSLGKLRQRIAKYSRDLRETTRIFQPVHSMIKGVEVRVEMNEGQISIIMVIRLRLLMYL